MKEIKVVANEDIMFALQYNICCGFRICARDAKTAVLCFFPLVCPPKKYHGQQYVLVRHRLNMKMSRCKGALARRLLRNTTWKTAFEATLLRHKLGICCCMHHKFGTLCEMWIVFQILMWSYKPTAKGTQFPRICLERAICFQAALEENGFSRL